MSVSLPSYPGPSHLEIPPPYNIRQLVEVQKKSEESKSSSKETDKEKQKVLQEQVNIECSIWNLSDHCCDPSKIAQQHFNVTTDYFISVIAVFQKQLFNHRMKNHQKPENEKENENHSKQWKRLDKFFKKIDQIYSDRIQYLNNEIQKIFFTEFFLGKIAECYNGNIHSPQHGGFSQSPAGESIKPQNTEIVNLLSNLYGKIAVLKWEIEIFCNLVKHKLSPKLIVFSDQFYNTYMEYRRKARILAEDFEHCSKSVQTLMSGLDKQFNAPGHCDKVSIIRERKIIEFYFTRIKKTEAFINVMLSFFSDYFRKYSEAGWIGLPTYETFAPKFHALHQEEREFQARLELETSMQYWIHSYQSRIPLDLAEQQKDLQLKITSLMTEWVKPHIEDASNKYKSYQKWIENLKTQKQKMRDELSTLPKLIEKTPSVNASSKSIKEIFAVCIPYTSPGSFSQQGLILVERSSPPKSLSRKKIKKNSKKPPYETSVTSLDLSHFNIINPISVRMS